MMLRDVHQVARSERPLGSDELDHVQLPKANLGLVKNPETRDEPHLEYNEILMTKQVSAACEVLLTPGRKL